MLVTAVQQSDSVKHPHVSTVLQILSPSRSLQRIAVLQYFGHLIQRTDSLGKTLTL